VSEASAPNDGIRATAILDDARRLALRVRWMRANFDLVHLRIDRVRSQVPSIQKRGSVHGADTIHNQKAVGLHPDAVLLHALREA
jgi:hypothetical protein